MIKILATIGVVYATVFIIIELFRCMSNAEKINLATSAIYAAVIAVITALIISTIVFLF